TESTCMHITKVLRPCIMREQKIQLKKDAYRV
ncbi:hypothetical protein, partial [Bacillus phage SPG24]